jgi:uncharacterized protein with PIN domain
MNRDIDWFEYERRKAVMRHSIGSFENYGAGIGRIVQALEADADRAEIHEAKTTDARCQSCGDSLFPIAGYFKPNEIGADESAPRAYEEAWRCHGCSGRFAESEVEIAA